jgi:transcriptional regulator with XRE-family HTH domain
MQVGRTIKRARIAYGLGLRELSRRSGVSPAQISRIESGEVGQPSVDTLVSIARGLDRNPAPLLIVSGHISSGEGRQILSEMFRPNRDGSYDPETDSELVDEWLNLGQKAEVEQARALLADETASERDLRKLAAEVFGTAETAETLWRDSFVEALAHKAGDDQLVRLVAVWEALPRERRAKVLDYATEQVELARLGRGSARGPLRKVVAGDGGR